MSIADRSHCSRLRKEGMNKRLAMKNHSQISPAVGVSTCPSEALRASGDLHFRRKQILGFGVQDFQIAHVTSVLGEKGDQPCLTFGVSAVAFAARYCLSSRQSAHDAGSNVRPLSRDDDQIVCALRDISQRSLKVYPAIPSPVYETCRAVVPWGSDTDVPPNPCVEGDRNERKLVLHGNTHRESSSNRRCEVSHQFSGMRYGDLLLLKASTTTEYTPPLHNRHFRPRLGFVFFCGEASSRYIGVSVGFSSRHLK